MRPPDRPSASPLFARPLLCMWSSLSDSSVLRLVASVRYCGIVLQLVAQCTVRCGAGPPLLDDRIDSCGLISTGVGASAAILARFACHEPASARRRVHSSPACSAAQSATARVSADCAAHRLGRPVEQVVGLELDAESGGTTAEIRSQERRTCTDGRSCLEDTQLPTRPTRRGTSKIAVAGQGHADKLADRDKSHSHSQSRKS